MFLYLSDFTSGFLDMKSYLSFKISGLMPAGRMSIGTTWEA